MTAALHVLSCGMPTSREPPAFIPPQVSQLIKSPPEGDAWAHELKYDGYRIHARLVRGDVTLLTRTGLDWTDRYQTTAKAFAAIMLRGGAYLDGELCAVRADGTTSFAELQAATDSRSTHHLYFAFDLLFLNGKDVRPAPLLDRKGRLEALRRRLLRLSSTAGTILATASASWTPPAARRPKASSRSVLMPPMFRAIAACGASRSASTARSSSS